MRLISRGKRKRYWQIVQFSERRELHFLQNYLYSFRLLDKKREIASGATGYSLVFFVWKRYFQLCVNKKPAEFKSILCVHSLYRPGWRWNQNNREAIVFQHFQEKRRIFNALIFAYKLVCVCSWNLKTLLNFWKYFLLSGRWGCSHSKWSSFTIKLKPRRIQCPVDVKFCGHSPNLQ